MTTQVNTSFAKSSIKLDSVFRITVHCYATSWSYFPTSCKRNFLSVIFR